MDGSKFTQKSLEALETCQKLADEYGNQEIVQEHLLYALLTIDDSLISKLIERMDINKEHFCNRILSMIEKRPKVSGGQPYVGNDLRKALGKAEVWQSRWAMPLFRWSTCSLPYLRHLRLI